MIDICLQETTTHVNVKTYGYLLQGCGETGSVEDGRRVHAHMLSKMPNPPMFLRNHLVSMYGKCGRVKEAEEVFHAMREKNVVSWTAMLTAYAHNGDYRPAVFLFRTMLWEGFSPNKVTLVTALNACSGDPECLEAGKMIHWLADEAGLSTNACVAVSLANMYGKCGDLDSAAGMLKVMKQPDVVGWSAVITGYTQQNRNVEALHLFYRMQQEGVTPNKITLVAILSACTEPASLPYGKLIHRIIAECTLESDVIVGSALMNMYSNCGSLGDVRRAFAKLRQPNVIAWTALISASVQFGECDLALKYFECMEKQKVAPDSVVYVPLINACARLTDLVQGRRLHSRIMETKRAKVDVQLGNALMNMYSKCGSLEEAGFVFERMRNRSRVSWNTMLSALAVCGRSEEVFYLFRGMQQEGVRPDEVSFVSVLFACNHAGSVEEACRCLGLSEEYEVELEAQHFGCVIDLLGRVGYLEEAECVVGRMQPPDVMAWMMLLDASRIHNQLERAKSAAERVLELDPGNSAAYIMYTQLT